LVKTTIKDGENKMKLHTHLRIEANCNCEPLVQLSESPHSWDHHLAQIISRVLSPPLLVLLGMMLMAKSLGGGEIYGWVVLYTMMTVLIPVVYIAIQVQRGRITDFHMKTREQRNIPLLLTFLCTIGAWWVMSQAQVPHALLIFAVIGIFQTGLLWLITLRWKISGHATTISGLAVFLCWLYGWIATPGLLVIPMVAWARVRLSRHDLWQTIVGTAFGVSSMVVALCLISW
jgi:hypothetical protein